MVVLKVCLTVLVLNVASVVCRQQELPVDVNSVHQGYEGPASTRSVLAEVARDMVARTATNSQVLSLNLTNLLILVVLKALLFGAGIFSFGLLGGGKGRSLAMGLSEPELLLMLSYLAGDANQQYECLYRVACETPDQAAQYASAAAMLIKGAKALNSTVVPYNERYEKIVSGLSEAVQLGKVGGRCAARYKCAKS